MQRWGPQKKGGGGWAYSWEEKSVTSYHTVTRGEFLIPKKKVITAGKKGKETPTEERKEMFWGGVFLLQWKGLDLSKK